MSSTALTELTQIEASLWEAADQLRANSKLTSSEYCMPVLGVIFLRQATNRYDAALAAIQADQAAGRMPKRPLKQADFKRRRALMLPPQAHYSHLMMLASSPGIGKALVAAMPAIEADFEPLLSLRRPGNCRTASPTSLRTLASRSMRWKSNPENSAPPATSSSPA